MFLCRKGSGRNGGKEIYYILNCVPLLINTGTPMVLPETDQDEADDEQETTHISSIKDDSGLALCFSEEKGRREGRKDTCIIF